MAATYVYRVIRLPEGIRQVFKQYRDKSALKNHEAIAALLESGLPTLTEGLAKLGIAKSTSRMKVRPMRLPFTANSLELLKRASTQTDLPQTLLLKVVLANAQPKRGRRAQS